PVSIRRRVRLCFYDAKAVLFSNDDLKISGSGTLNITAGKNHAIKSDDKIDIDEGTIIISAENDGIHANEDITIANAVIGINAGGDGIQSESALTISNTTLDITTNGTAENDTADGTAGDVSSKGLKAETTLTVTGGSFNINSYDHAIHSADKILIHDGSFEISSQTGKGISGHGDVTVNGGEINIIKSTEGIESKAILTVNDGIINITSDDDGLNAGGGMSGPGGRGGFNRNDPMNGNNSHKNEFDGNAENNGSNPDKNKLTGNARKNDNNSDKNSSNENAQNSGSNSDKSKFNGQNNGNNSDKNKFNSQNNGSNSGKSKFNENASGNGNDPGMGDLRGNAPGKGNIKNGDIPPAPPENGAPMPDMPGRGNPGNMQIPGNAGKQNIPGADNSKKTGTGISDILFGRDKNNTDAQIDNDVHSIIINGGTININAEGDGIDSNGDIIVNGGTVIVEGPTRGGNGALDCGDFGSAGIYLNGGTVIASGSSSMFAAQSESSRQCSVSIFPASTVQGGTAFYITDENGNVKAEYTPSKQYECVTVSSPMLEAGKTYKAYIKDISESNLAGSFTASANASVGTRSFGFGGRR
ncbi:MAG: carbohydrate-binding domain-containing protein, partial [Oscillospiraceae bacterium]|nr:carbohydrate-binding domain-containing protein [Oscillospiraceae bacterium]